jgi:hypothetical protein
MSVVIKAIETEYSGHRFRSRLEARWALFFDTLKIAWEYEPEGFELATGEKYLPDFFLPKFHDYDAGLWVEVKPHGGDFSKAREFATSGKKILLLEGPPATKAFLLAGDTCSYQPGEIFETSVCFAEKYIPEGRNGNEYRLYTHCDGEGEAELMAGWAIEDAVGHSARAFRWTRPVLERGVVK